MPEDTERKELPGPGQELARLVRGGLVARGSSISGFAREAGVHESTVRYALYGLSDTEEARALRTRAMVAAGLVES
jgi:hypothetical protein